MPALSLRFLGIALLLSGYSACTVPVAGPAQGEDPDDVDNGGSWPSCGPTVCAIDDSSCDGSWQTSCTSVAGCAAWFKETDCHTLGASCTDGTCVFDEACPPNTDAFCRAGYVLRCSEEKIASFDRCLPAATCTDTVLSSGRGAAACSFDGSRCTSESPDVRECQGTDLVNCSYGLATFRHSCSSGCVLATTPEGKLEPSCRGVSM